jgi:hypothetical protein
MVDVLVLDSLSPDFVPRYYQPDVSDGVEICVAEAVYSTAVRHRQGQAGQYAGRRTSAVA